MLYSEFLNGINKEHGEGTAFAYQVINKLYMDDKIRTQADCFRFFNRYASDFMWVNDINLTNGMKAEKPKNLHESISYEEAIEIISEWYGFEADKIIICHTPYYAATDFNYIVFSVKRYERVLLNGELYDVSR